MNSFSLSCFVISLLFYLGSTDKAHYLNGQNGWEYVPLHTFGETIGNYTPPGIGDGLGAYWNEETQTVWVISNHELQKTQGYSYSLKNGVSLTGARLTVYEFSKAGELLRARQAFDKIYDRKGKLVEHPSQVNERDPSDSLYNTAGLDRFCSGAFHEPHVDGFVDGLYIVGEEAQTYFGHPHGGSIWAYDPQSDELWALPDFGRGSWENAAPVDVGEGKIGLITTNDAVTATPITLYIGTKDPNSKNILKRNGLKGGKVYAWFSETGETEPSQFMGTGNTLKGYFAPITIKDESMAGQQGYDSQGYLDDTVLITKAFEQGAFQFPRPEDGSTNPNNRSQVLVSLTGLGTTYLNTNWGSLAIFDIDGRGMENDKIRADFTLYYDGYDTKFQDFGLRNPDNLFWSPKEKFFVCEDTNTILSSPVTGCTTQECFDYAFGGRSQVEVTLWMMDSNNSPSTVADMTRIAITNRKVELLEGCTDSESDLIGEWEISGVKEASWLFDFPGTLLVANLQAHTVKDCVIEEKILGEGGQLFFLRKMDDDFDLKTKVKKKGQEGNTMEVKVKVENKEMYTFSKLMVKLEYDGKKIDWSQAQDDCWTNEEEEKVLYCEKMNVKSDGKFQFKIGLVKPDGKKLTVNTYGTISYSGKENTMLVESKTYKLDKL